MKLRRWVIIRIYLKIGENSLFIFICILFVFYLCFIFNLDSQENEEVTPKYVEEDEDDVDDVVDDDDDKKSSVSRYIPVLLDSIVDRNTTTNLNPAEAERLGLGTDVGSVINRLFREGSDGVIYLEKDLVRQGYHPIFSNDVQGYVKRKGEFVQIMSPADVLILSITA